MHASTLCFALPLAALAGCQPNASRPVNDGGTLTAAPPASTTATWPPGPPAPAAPKIDDAAVPGNTPKPIANPLVSRGKPVFGSGLNPKGANDGSYKTYGGTWQCGKVTAENPGWVAIKIGSGPTRLLLNWHAGGSFNYLETDYGSPGAYRIETSNDSTNGVNGTWKTVVTVPNVLVHGQANSFDFTGQSWVKMVVTGIPSVSPNGVGIDEIDVHDVSAAISDTWFFMGDSITAFAFDRVSDTHQPSFAAIIAQRHAGFFPEMINGGIGGENSLDATKHIDEWLKLNPDQHFWGLGYGTNDSAGNTQDPAPFKSNMQTLITKIKAAGHVPILARIPFATDGQHDHIPSFNRAIDELTASNGLLPGPDLYEWFKAHPDELRDKLHPTDQGIVSMNRLWADAMERLYTR
jgi:lysophospholipase L1-like esterase